MIARAHRRHLLVALGAASCWATAAWCARGVLAVTGASADAPRVGLLPPPGQWVALLIGGWVVAATPAVRRLPLAPIYLSVLAVLPWVPAAPAPWLVWTGPATRLVWAAVVVGLVAAHAWSGWPFGPRVRRGLTDPRRAPWVAVTAALVIFGSAAWRTAPSVPGGDEPHYLIITQSLLHDFDLKIENNHRQRDYAAYFAAGELKPDYLRRGRNGEIYSVHAPGLPALVAPAFAIGGYPAVKVFLILGSALGAGLAWALAFRVSGDVGAAWFGWAAVCLSTSWVFHTFTVYPDGVGAILVLVGVWTLARLHLDAGRPVSTRALGWTGAALAVLPWLHTRFAVLAALLGAFLVWRVIARDGWRAGARRAAVLLAAPAASAAGWVFFFYAIYGTADPLAPYGSYFRTQASWAFVTSGLGGLFFDQQFGLMPYAPALVAPFAGLALMARDRSHRRLVLELVVLMVLYLVSVTRFRMWWAGWSAPARFVVPLLLPLAAPAAVAWARARCGATRAVWVAALAWTGFATASLVLVDGGRLAYNVRDGYALWLDWLSLATELALGAPSFHRTAEAAAWLHVVVWAGALAAAWWALVWLERRGVRGREALATATPAVLAVAAMAALGLVWRLNGTSGLAPAPSELELVRRAPGWRGVAVTDRPAGVLPPEAVAASLAIEPPPRWLAGRDRALFVVPGVPAGAYALDVELRGGAAGEIHVSVGSESLALRTVALADVATSGGARIDLRLPVAVHSLVARGDERARASVGRVVLRPRALDHPRPPLAGLVARQAARYPGGTVYFVDDGAFPESGALWVRGGREAVVVLDTPGRPAAGGGRTAALFLRNAPVDNELVIQVGAWREAIALAPREERTVLVPLARDAATVARLRARTGFRPSEWEPGSRDERFLGVWVELRP